MSEKTQMCIASSLMELLGIRGLKMSPTIVAPALHSPGVVEYPKDPARLGRLGDMRGRDHDAHKKRG